MRAYKWIALVGLLGCSISPIMARGQELKYPSKPYPEIDGNTVVMIEIWPDVGDITFHSYFIDRPPERAVNLCLAAKRVFDRDSEAMAKTQKQTATSSRQCLTLPQAVAKGYIKSLPTK